MRQKLKICMIVLLVAAILATFFQPLFMYARNMLPIGTGRSSDSSDGIIGFAMPAAPITPQMPSFSPEFIGPQEFIAFEPTAGIIKPAWNAVEAALKIIKGIGGVTTKYDVIAPTALPMLPIFVDPNTGQPLPTEEGEAWRKFLDGSGLNSQAQPWDPMGDIFNAGASAFTWVKNAAGEYKRSLSTPLHVFESFLTDIQPGISNFIGPIDMDAANEAWAIGSPWMMHVPARAVVPHLVGTYKGVPIFTSAFNGLSESQRIAVLSNYKTSELMVRESSSVNALYTIGDFQRSIRTQFSMQFNSASKNIKRNGDEVTVQSNSQVARIESLNLPMGNHCLWVDLECLGFFIIKRNEMQGDLFNAISGRWASSEPHIRYGQPEFSRVIVTYSTHIEESPIFPAFDLSLAYANIITDPDAAFNAIREKSGAQSDNDPVYIFIPPTLEEFEELIRRIMEGDEDAINAFIIPPTWEPVDYVPEGQDEQNRPGIPQSWLDMVERHLKSIDEGVHTQPQPVDLTRIEQDVESIARETGNMRRAIDETNNNLRQLPAAIGNTMVGSMQFDFSNDRNLSMLFPFSIPFDLYRMIGSLNVPAKAPRFEIDFEGTVFDVNYIADELNIPQSNLPGAFVMVLDMENFESVAQIIRWTVWLSFVVGLMFATSKVIKW